MTALSSQDRRAEAASLAQRVLLGVLALSIGAFLVWGAGFAGPSTVHNVGHDSRHSLGFPCH